MTAALDSPSGRATNTAAAAKRWLTVNDIADDLRVSTSTVYKWSSRGQPFFPRSIRLRNGDLRVRQDWYEQWLTDLEVSD